MHTSVTSTRSKVKVKVKVTELPKLRKVHFSRSMSSAVFAWSSNVMVGAVIVRDLDYSLSEPDF